jgi:hypothetical protein
MKKRRNLALVVALAALAALALDYSTGTVGVVSSAGILGAPDRTGFKGTDEELQAVTAPDRDAGRAGRVATTMDGNPDGVSTTMGGNPEGVSTTMGGNPDG